MAATTRIDDRAHIPVRRDELPWALGQGAMFGVVAGVVFAAFEMMTSAALMGPAALWTPLRMIGAIALGRPALDPSYSLALAGFAGLVVHVMLSVLYGMIFAVVAGGLKSRAWDIGLGALFGFVLWIVNFYVVAPRLFPWFLESSPTVQFIAHTFFFGAVLGYLVWRGRSTRPAAIAM